MTTSPRLSICIATFKRGDFIVQTLDSIVGQLTDAVELLVVDGASPDHTEQIMRAYCERHPRVRYIREAVNSGIDADYDKAVGYARGEYCWLMTDDDLMVGDAVARVLAHLDDVDVVVVNSEVRNKDLSSQLRPRLLRISHDKHFDEPSGEAVFREMADYLSFIGGVVVRRAWWLQRERTPYYGTLFVHIGVLFQNPPVTRVQAIADPLLIIRFGNAMWSARSFEIWMFKWPTLIWSFKHFSQAARAAISAPMPYLSIKRLLWFRAIGGYTAAEYRKFLLPCGTHLSRLSAAAIARLPAKAANFFCALYYIIRSGKAAKMELYDLSRSENATALARRAAALRGLR
ncbi:glycosyltransferase family 2 protein [Rhizobacter sp. SG703]|uniref:glycosyltransferase family 2 protein n=1 Tax=Rhizobacter sp. SG703 TaxID=2587140 RepID=UPI001444A38F|nr:glycosyltransferase family 2 protein [Rhizobacter sp. SG703]NKI95069.1 glycosyltransferase involved in cell wall biosynthesis [Rhizobacter sp. SG703]